MPIPQTPFSVLPPVVFRTFWFSSMYAMSCSSCSSLIEYLFVKTF